MIKKFLIIIMLLGALLGAGIYFSSKKAGCISKKELVSQQYNIAILIPVSHPSLTNIENGFKDSLNKLDNCSFKFKTYNANGNMVLMRSQLEDISQNKFDLIFAITTPCAQMAKEITAKKESNIPVIFGAVTDPILAGLVEDFVSPKTITGVADILPLKKSLKFFQC